MVIYSGFSYKKWWFSIAMLVYHSVGGIIRKLSGTCEFGAPLALKGALGYLGSIGSNGSNAFLASRVDHWSNCPCKMSENPEQLRIRPWSCSCCDCQNLQSETLGDSALDTARQLPIAFNLITGSLRPFSREAFVMWLYWHRKHNVQRSLDTRLENHCDADASSSCSWNDPKLSSPWKKADSLWFYMFY